jgi:hypothetical protein
MTYTRSLSMTKGLPQQSSLIHTGLQPGVAANKQEKPFQTVSHNVCFSTGLKPGENESRVPGENENRTLGQSL